MEFLSGKSLKKKKDINCEKRMEYKLTEWLSPSDPPGLLSWGVSNIPIKDSPLFQVKAIRIYFTLYILIHKS